MRSHAKRGLTKAKLKQTECIQGYATHRRTEGDYMGVLLDAVTLDDWRGVVTDAIPRRQTRRQSPYAFEHRGAATKRG